MVPASLASDTQEHSSWRIAHEAEVERNYLAFSEMLPALMRDHEGAFALLRHQRVERLFVTRTEAYDTAWRAYPDGLFSIGEVTDKPLELGAVALALDLRTS